MLVYCSCVLGVPTELVAGRLITHAVPAVPAVAAVRLATADLNQGYDLNPQYNFGYSVADTLTGDAKTREESRDGDVVRGSYSVADPDGRIRTVTYTADAEHGFVAKVTYDGQEGPVAIPFDAPAVAAAPAVAPVAVAAPVVSNDAVIAVRAPNQTARTRESLLSLFRQLPQSQLVNTAAAPVISTVRQTPQAIHRFHNLPAISAVRAVPQAVHVVPHTPAVSAVRQIPAVTAHAVHNLPTVTAVRQAPAALHQLHTLPAGFSTLRTAPTALHQLPHTVSAVRELSPADLQLNNFDLSQFRFVSPVNFIQ